MHSHTIGLKLHMSVEFFLTQLPTDLPTTSGVQTRGLAGATPGLEEKSTKRCSNQ